MTGRPEQQSLDFNLVPLVTALLPSGDRTEGSRVAFSRKSLSRLAADFSDARCS